MTNAASELFSLVLGLMLSTSALAQQVCSYSGPVKPLARRWEWAGDQARMKGWSGNYWIGYSIQKSMSPHSFIGSWSSDQERNRPSLSAMITGMQQTDADGMGGIAMHGEFEGACLDADTLGAGPLIRKEVGFLFHYSADGGITHLTVSNTSLHVDLQRAPLIWVNGAVDSESVDFLEQLYGKSSGEKIREELIFAIGVHDPNGVAPDFLINVLQKERNGGLRKEAAFALGQGESSKALPELLSAAKHDESGEVREEAIFAISQMKGEDALDDLILLAKEEKNIETRKKAVFWLGQDASKKSVSTLDEIAERGDDVEVQKNAVFALSQLPGNEGMDSMIRLASSGENAEVRKTAIFWLGQSDDPRAVEALIRIVKK